MAILGGLGLVAALFAPAGAEAQTGTVPVRGVITDARGNPVDATVRLYLEPDPLPMARGTRVVAGLVDEASTDSEGRFAVGSSMPALAGGTSNDNDGFITFELHIFGDGWFMPHTLSRKPTGEGWIDGLNRIDPAVELSVDSDKHLVMESTHAARAATCVVRKRRLSSRNKLTTIGEYHAARDVSGRFSYGEKADSEISVGAGADGQSWSIAGSKHIGNSRESIVKWKRSKNFHRELDTKFRYGKWKVSFEGPRCPDPYYRVIPDHWGTGAREGDRIFSVVWGCRHRPKKYRAVFAKGTSLTRNESNATWFKKTVCVFGACLSSQSGFSSNVVSHWNFGRKRERHLMCGNNALPSRAKRVFSGKGPRRGNTDCKPVVLPPKRGVSLTIGGRLFGVGLLAAAVLLCSCNNEAAPSPPDRRPGAQGPIRDGRDFHPLSLSFAVEVGKPFFWGVYLPPNVGDEPASLSSAVTDSTPRALELVAVRVADAEENGGLLGNGRVWPPKHYRLHPVEGYNVPSGYDTGQVVFAFRAVKPGRFRIDRVHIEYEVGNRRFETVTEQALTVCAPMKEWTQRCRRRLG